MNSDAAVGLLEWCIEIGDDECIGEAPVDHFELEIQEKKRLQRQDEPIAIEPSIRGDSTLPDAPSAVSRDNTRPRAGGRADEVKMQGLAISEAISAADDTRSLEALRKALSNYSHCELKKLAQNLVFSDGHPCAHVMIIGEAPGADEDRLGRPFVGRAGRLLDRMFAEIDLSREEESPERSLYITNILPWRPPGNRNPTPNEIDMLLPFVKRHVELVEPKLLVLMGNISCNALLGKGAITRRHGNWHEWKGIPVMPMYHPAYLLRNPVAKGGAWIDLLKIRAFLIEKGMR